MNHHLLLSLALVMAIWSCDGLAQAQQKNSTTEKAETSDAALREKAFKLLESVTGELTTLQSAENRARLGANIAESLWKHDEKRARALFVLVEDDIRAGLQNRRSDDPRDEHTLLVFLQLRMDTVERIAKHDAELAFAFLKATELSDDTPRRYAVAEAERALEVRLAKQISAENPDLALKLGRQSLARGFSNDLLPVLRRLHRKHREQGVRLYKDIIVKLRNADLAQDWNAMYFARLLGESLKPPEADETAFRDLISIFIATALANGCGKTTKEEGAYFCSQLAAFLPHMEKVDPLRAAQLKHWAPEEEEPPPLAGAYYELSDLTEDGTVDELLALAPRYPQIEVEIYRRAVMKAQASGDLDRARKIATDYKGDAESRQRMLELVEQDKMLASINDKELEEIQGKLSTIPHVQERVRALLFLAYQIEAKDRKAAQMLLNQASAMIDTMKPDKEQTEAQMALAIMYCLENNDRGLAIMESLVPKLNELIAAAAKLDGYDNRYLRDGEWNMTGEGGLGSLLTNLANNAGYFAWCDFDRAVSLAAQFERPEIRLMAQLKLAQGILAGPPKRLIIVDGPMH